MIVTSLQLEMNDRLSENGADSVNRLLDRIPDSDLVMLPEMWPVGFFNFDKYAAQSEPIEGPLVDTLRNKAIQKNCFIHMGSFVEKDGPNLFNTSLLFDGNGEIVAKYRKIHLFGFESQEQRLLTPGTDVVVAETPFAKIGLSTCYDLRFPELFRKMVDKGAFIFLVTSAWPKARSEAWKLFNKARAHENLSFLISCNCAGSNKGNQYAGYSMFVGPMGDVLKAAGEEGATITFEIDPEEANSIRRSFPALEDRTIH